MMLTQGLYQTASMQLLQSHSHRSLHMASLEPLFSLSLNDLERVREHIEQMSEEERKYAVNPKVKGNGGAAVYDDGLMSLLTDSGVSQESEPEINIGLDASGKMQLEYLLDKMPKEGNNEEDNFEGRGEHPNMPPQLLEDVAWIYNAVQKVYETVLNRQQEYIETSDAKKLKPLIYKDIGKELKIDESTAWRLAQGRTVRMPDQSIMPLRAFFVSEDDVHRLAAYEILGKMIRDGKYPETDEEAMRTVNEQTGLQLHRRTIAKYRGAIENRLRKKILGNQQTYESESEESEE